jgi:DNA-binding response OmpR family regulator
MPKPILIVDDEPQIRSMLKKLLSRNGFETIESADGQSALSTVRNRSGDIAALIADVETTGISGTELARVVRAEFPTVPILLMSAIPNWGDELDQNGPESGFVQKPFDPATFMRKLRNLLP